MKTSLLEYRINNRQITRQAAEILVGKPFQQICMEAFRFWSKSDQNISEPFSRQLNNSVTLTISYIQPLETA
jgi:hypothetical protein